MLTLKQHIQTQSQSFYLGLAMFSMFFGAGNIIFPLAVGQYAGSENLYGAAGLILTGTIMPIGGVIAMILFDGNYSAFFGRLGKVPGFCLALLTISLLGPLGSTPRCIALSYTTLKSALFGLHPILFSAAACGLVFLLSFRKNRILPILGWVLTPILLTSLIGIIIIGLWTPSTPHSIQESSFSIFLHGLKEGYNTMDLLAAFFFSSAIVRILKDTSSTSGSYVSTALGASVIGGILLGAIYIGFSSVAALHGSNLSHVCKDELLTALVLKIAGPYATALVSITVAVACLTTAIALISAFTDFLQKEVFQNKIRYETLLAGSLLLTFFISTFEFTGISAFLGPILQICYPGLILLTFLNIAYRLKNVQPIKTPVFLAFAIAAYWYFL